MGSAATCDSTVASAQLASLRLLRRRSASVCPFSFGANTLKLNYCRGVACGSGDVWTCSDVEMSFGILDGRYRLGRSPERACSDTGRVATVARGARPTWAFTAAVRTDGRVGKRVRFCLAGVNNSSGRIAKSQVAPSLAACIVGVLPISHHPNAQNLRMYLPR